MSDVQTAVAAAGGQNPFDPDSFVHGGGLWDGKTVTITSAVAKTEALKYGDGKPVVDAKTGQQSIQTALYLTGIAEGGDDKERHEEYSVGDKLAPTPDGHGFVDKVTGKVGFFHANSNMGKLSAAIKGSGFDISTLIERAADGTVVKHRLDKLVGARFVFKGEPKIGRDGKPLVDKKGYSKNVHLPVKFVGFAGGVTASAPRPGNGAVAATSNDALATKAQGAVLAALAAAEGGKLTRAKLIQTLAQQLAGDADSNSIIGLIVNDVFHKGRPWQYDGKDLSL